MQLAEESKQVCQLHRLERRRDAIHFSDFEPALEEVQLFTRKKAAVLQLSHDQAGRDPKRYGKPRNLAMSQAQ